MRKLFSLLLATTALAFSYAAQAEDEKLFVKGAELYTLTNLHPDNINNRLYATNYQQPALMKRCTKVVVDKISKKKMLFTADGVQYTYLYHKSAVDKLDKHLELYFGKKCSNSAVTKLSATDQKGIKRGQVTKGMTKQGVIYAIGYPPKHVTPNIDEMESWTYWSNKFNRFIVHFENGKVIEIQE